MDADQLKSRLLKMKALADGGIGGERDAAENLIRKLAAKYGMSLDDIDSEIEREHTVDAKLGWQVTIFLQLLGLMRIEQYGSRHANKLNMFLQKTRRGYRGRGKARRQIWAKRYFTVCTDAQWLELTAKYSVLCADYIKQLKAFPRAFLVRNDLLMPYNPDAPEPTAEQKEEFDIAENLASGIKKSLLCKQLEMKD